MFFCEFWKVLQDIYFSKHLYAIPFLLNSRSKACLSRLIWSITSFRDLLTLSWRRSLSYRNQPIDLQSKSMDWFLYDEDLSHEKVKDLSIIYDGTRSKNSERSKNAKHVQREIHHRCWRRSKILLCHLVWYFIST